MVRMTSYIAKILTVPSADADKMALSFLEHERNRHHTNPYMVRQTKFMHTDDNIEPFCPKVIPN